MTAAHAASQERPQPHMKQSANGCVTCPRKWSDHTESERAWAQERPYDDGERILPSEGMDRAVQPEAPATEAGRYLVMWDESDAEPLDLFGYQTVREAVLAVEAEMSDVIEAHAASQERPSIDMERLRLIVFGVTGYAFNDYAWDQIAAEYERLGDRT
jgi:hypothetical protein